MALNNATSFTGQPQQGTPIKVPTVRPSGQNLGSFDQVSNVSSSPNTIAGTVSNTNYFFSSKLLNYVEKVTINGYSKTVFYSELSTNLKVDDKVFIINGYYDSDTLIQKNKYKRSTDGYRVIGIDGCKIILDIDYSGELPYTDFDLSDLFYVHNITSQAQFDYVNSLSFGLSQSNFQGVYSSFLGYSDGNYVNLVGSNCIFVSSTFNSSLDLNIINKGISASTPGFFYKQADGNWVSMNLEFDNFLIKDGNQLTNSIEKTKIVIIGEDFTYKGKIYRERVVYEYVNGGWVFDKIYKQPIISKLNFRYGKFTGLHKDGIFGSYDRVANWNSSAWSSGFMINSVWNSGNMNNKSKSEQSYVAKIVQNTLGNTQVVQNVDFSNNRGFGYNYIIDSTFKSGKINQANFENSNIGLTISTRAIDSFYSNAPTYSVISEKVNYNFCDIFSTYMVNSSVADSIVENSNIFKSKSVNNQIIDTVIDLCQYNSDGGLQILGADLWSYDPSMRVGSFFATPSDTTSYDKFDFSSIRGKLKLFISNKDFLRLEKGDSFYLEKINKEVFLRSLNTDEKIHIPIETRYLLDYYTEYEFYDNDKISKISVTLNPSVNNKLKTYIKTGVEQTVTLLQAPNTNANSGGAFYWDVNYTFRGDWIQDEIYQDQDVVNYYQKLYSREGTFTSSNNIPIENDLALDRSWTTLATTFSYWNSTVPNNIGDFVFASKVETLAILDVFQGMTFSLYKCLTKTGDGGSPESVVVESIFSKNATLNKKTKILEVENNGINLSSIDIESEIFGWYKDTLDGNKLKYSRSDSPMVKLPINSMSSLFVNNYIKASDIRSGLFVNSTWQSGYNLNYYSNRIRKSPNNNLIIYYTGPKTLNVSITNTPNSINYLTRGLDIRQDDTVWLNGVSYEGPSGRVNLTGRYKVLNNPTRLSNSNSVEINITPQFETPNFVQLVKTYSVFRAEGNNYTTLSKLSIENSTINYGFFKRTQFKDTVIQNDQFDNTDEKFNTSNVNLLRLVNIISNNNNIEINDGVIYRSHLVNGKFNTGIVHNSVWNGLTFSSGIFSNGSWESGTFVSGKFLNSNSTTRVLEKHDTRNIYKNWQNGIFQSGEFVNSVWLNGTFSNGRFYNSHFYGGTWDNGILGSRNTNLMNTSFGYYAKLSDIGVTVSIWNTGVVENAVMGGYGVVYWYGGKYNSGEFTSYGTTPDNESIWYNGEFNGSKFTNLARWKNGVFNSGKFLSYYGWENVGPTNSSNLSTDYGWENGYFNSGEFGNKGLTSNSVWYNGVFLGGEFLGRFWKNGYFVSGNFYGSGPKYSFNSQTSYDDEYLYADSFTYSYYGIWNSGYVIENIREISTESGNSRNLTRFSNQSNTIFTNAYFSNILWLSGTFSHDNSTLENSLWLAGNFRKGKFSGGVFNPYVDRDFTGSFSNVSFGDQAIWNNGTFVTGSFWMSDWNNGTFKNGFMSGARWTNGTWEYGNANNIYWENGTWKNGNWNGSPYGYELLTQTESNIEGVTVSRILLDEGREKDVLWKMSTYNPLTDPANGATQANVHLLNVFSVSSVEVVFINEVDNTNNWVIPVGEKYTGLVKIGGSNNFPILESRNLDRSDWVIDNQIVYVKTFIQSNYFGTIGKKPLTYYTLQNSNLYTIGGSVSYVTPQKLFGYNPYSDPDVPPSSRIYATYSGSSNIFQANYDYSIAITVAVELADRVEVEFFVGGLSSSIFVLDSDNYKWTEGPQVGNIKGGLSSISNAFVANYAKFYTITLSYNTGAGNVTGDGAKFSFRKNSNGKLRVLKSIVTRRRIQYHPTLNNVLYPAIDLVGNTFSLPATSSISYNTLSSTGYLVGAKFGNGVFKSGVWENGVWNNGYRSGIWFDELDIIRAKNVEISKTYRLEKNKWVVTISTYDSIAGLINVGDLIAVSNVVVYDINGNRNFFREPLKVLKSNGILNEITFEYTSTFEIRTIQKDSDLHLIYVTKNIWQNGVFLNGYFEGIWNNGVFIGYPKTTEMVGSHWINGYFEGGHFVSSKVLANQSEGLPTYNTGLVQSMVFKDKNVATPPLSAYESWMDVNYSTFSSVNLSNFSRLAGISKGAGSRPIETFIPNLKGSPTEDVFYSESYFRNYNNNAIRKYVLGSKFRVYTDILGENSKFNTPFILSPSNNLSAQQLQIQEKAPLSNLLTKGWTFSFVGDISPSQGNRVFVSSNVSSFSDEKLILEIQNESDGGQNRPKFLFENTKFISAPNRYYFTEVLVSVTASKRQNTNSEIAGYDVYMNEYATYQPQSISLFNFENSTSVREYFFNLKSCQFNFILPDLAGASLSITKMAVYETDSIPFFQYATASKIDLGVKNPYVGIAPPIDYTNQNTNFVGNTELGIDYRTILKQNSDLKRQNGFIKEIKSTDVQSELDSFDSTYRGSTKYTVVIKGDPGTQGG